MGPFQKNKFDCSNSGQVQPTQNKKTCIQNHYTEKFNKPFTGLENQQNSSDKQKKTTKQLLSYLDDLSKTQQSSVSTRIPPGFSQKKRISFKDETFQFNNKNKKVESNKKFKVEFKKGDVAFAPYGLDKTHYPAKILELYQDNYKIYWLEQKIQSK